VRAQISLQQLSEQLDSLEAATAAAAIQATGSAAISRPAGRWLSEKKGRRLSRCLAPWGGFFQRERPWWVNGANRLKNKRRSAARRALGGLKRAVLEQKW